MIEKVRVIGGGLAGCEASLQLLKRGYSVELYEMRGVKNTPCHKTTNLAELVCSNSLKSVNEDTGHGLLKLELENKVLKKANEILKKEIAIEGSIID